MKNSQLITAKLTAIPTLLVTLLVLATGLAAAQSLGDYARAVRKNKVEPPAASRQFDNDNLPTNEAVSVVGPDSTSDAKSGASAATDLGAERQKTVDATREKIDKQKDKLTSLNHDLELAQREYRTRAAAVYADPLARLRNPIQWDAEDAKLKADVDSRQKAVDAAHQELDTMQEQAHKAGMAPSEKDDSNKDKSQDTSKDK